MYLSYLWQINIFMAIVVLSRYADPVFLYERLAYSLWRNNFSRKWMIKLVTCSEERACYFLGQNNVGQNYSLGKNFVTYEKLFYFRYSPFLYHKNNKKRKKIKQTKNTYSTFQQLCSTQSHCSQSTVALFLPLAWSFHYTEQSSLRS